MSPGQLACIYAFGPLMVTCLILAVASGIQSYRLHRRLTRP